MNEWTLDMQRLSRALSVNSVRRPIHSFRRSILRFLPFRRRRRRVPILVTLGSTSLLLSILRGRHTRRIAILFNVAICSRFSRFGVRGRVLVLVLSRRRRLKLHHGRRCEGYRTGMSVRRVWWEHGRVHRIKRGMRRNRRVRVPVGGRSITVGLTLRCYRHKTGVGIIVRVVTLWWRWI